MPTARKSLVESTRRSALARPPEPRTSSFAPLIVLAAALAATAPLAFDVLPPLMRAFSLFLDGALTLMLGAALLAVQKPGWRATFVCALLAALPLAASAAKFAALGETAVAGDLLLVVDAARTLPYWQVAAAAAIVLALLALFALGLRRPTAREAAVAFAAPAIVVGGLVAASLSPAAAAAVAKVLPMQQFSLPVYGHWLQAATRFVEEVERAHVRAAAGDLDAAELPQPIGTTALPPLAARNVHIVVAESLVDPSWLAGFAHEPDPAPPVLRAWRARGGSDRALVPIFGNRSSNTEFEVLCGVPALTHASGLVFNAIARPLPCLPRLLAERGFATEGRVPSHPAFFSAESAYRHIGFTHAEFDRDFAPMHDLDGRWLSAEATLAHARERIAARLAQGRPFLDYTFVNAAHFPFERDRAKRPDIVAVSPYDAAVHGWANAAYWSFAAVELHLAWLAAHDPDAIVVVLGDHAPPLGADHAPYRASGRAENGLVAGPTGEPGMMQTPLFVLDAGVPVATGVLPAHAIPELVLDRLSGGRLCAMRACLHRAEARLRPHRRTPMIAAAADDDRARVRACLPSDADAACVAARRETLAWDVVLARLLAGAPVPAGDTRENDGGARAQHVSSAK
ncbi:sulfatase-like hydrolase/transferase [Salinarimonas sp. NSM]|uniref:sulfatase-like hydrolase/transferase n=1 Tax=Salinarimonas sp. NSM TaxID=3458003 RepID=UPI0040361190